MRHDFSHRQAFAGLYPGSQLGPSRCPLLTQHRDIAHRCDLAKNTLDQSRPNFTAADIDQIIQPSGQMKTTLVVQLSQIAGPERFRREDRALAGKVVGSHAVKTKRYRTTVDNHPAETLDVGFVDREADTGKRRPDAALDRRFAGRLLEADAATFGRTIKIGNLEPKAGGKGAAPSKR